MRLRVNVAIVLSISLIVSGCGGSNSTFTPTPTQQLLEPIDSPIVESGTPTVTPTLEETDELVESKPAKFELDSLSIEPNSIILGEATEISANVTNVGDVDGTYTAILTANDEQVELKEFDIGAGSIYTVSFAYTPVTTGLLKIGLGELTSELEIEEPVLSGPAEVDVTTDEASISYPNMVGFALKGTSVLPVIKISLEYGTDKRTLVNETSRVEPEYAPGNNFSTSWIWQMTETYGAVPPGAKIWWRWRITDEDNRMYTTPRQIVAYKDTRFSWRAESREGLKLYYYDRDSRFGKELTDGIEEKLARIELNVEIPEERKIQVYVYDDIDEFRSSVPFAPGWAGGLAFTQYNIIVYVIRADHLEWGKETLAHEITHLLIEEVTFGPFGDVPTWLNEGLAQYTEGDSTQQLARSQVDSAIQNNELLSLKSLGGSFPAASDQAHLAYAESASVVSYLIETHGWDKIRELLEVFKDGSTYDRGLEKVYSFDINGLEEEWLTYIGTKKS